MSMENKNLKIIFSDILGHLVFSLEVLWTKYAYRKQKYQNITLETF